MSLPAVPLYLQEPNTSGYTYGTVTYDKDKDSYVIAAEPAVLVLAKRVFPGSRMGEDGKVRFPAQQRMVGLLNWLMLLYPLQIDCPERFQEDRQKAIAHAWRRDSRLELPPVSASPHLLHPLYDFQREGVAYMAANERCILADQMGLGKTIQALAALAHVEGAPAVVVCPTNVTGQWQTQAGRFLDLPTEGQVRFDETDDDRGRRLCHIIQGRKPYQLPPKAIYIIHYGLLAEWYRTLMELRPKVIIFDEVQELRHPDTQKYTGASELAGITQYAWGLSGTPVYNYGDEIWAVTNILDYHCLGDRDSFTKEWCYGYGQHQVINPKALGDYLRREGLVLRRRKVDVQQELPPKRRLAIHVDHDDDQYTALVSKAVELAKQYDQIRNWHEKGLTTREIEGAARQATGIAKAPYVAAFVRSLLQAGERVLLYAHHHAVHDIYHELLADFHPVEISGRMSDKQKKASKVAFMGGATNLILLALRSTAGLDGLQTRGSCVVKGELDWSPAIHTQCEDRVHRIGIDPSLEQVMCYYMVADTETDLKIQDVLGVKVGQFVGLMGDEEETEDAEILAQQAAEQHMTSVIEKLKQRKVVE